MGEISLENMKYKNLTIFNIIRWVDGTIVSSDQASDVPSIIFFFIISC